MASLYNRASALLRRMQFAGSSGPLRSELTPQEMRVVQSLYDEIDVAGSTFKDDWDKFTVAQQKAAVLGRNAIKNAKAAAASVELRARNLGASELADKAKQMLARLSQLDKYTQPSVVAPQI